MRLALFIALFLSLNSCVEISGEAHIEKVTDLISEADSLENMHRQTQIDNLMAIEKWSDSIDIKIRRLFKPVPYEVGKDISAFADLNHNLQPFIQNDSIIKNRLIFQKTQLVHLKTDIENGGGKRGKYLEYINRESANIDTLRDLINQRDSIRIGIIRTFNELQYSLDSNLNEIFLKE